MAAGDPDTTVLITGAAGNLGSLLARHLAESELRLRLMFHRTPIAPDLLAASNVSSVQADLSRPESLPSALAGADVVVHFAGVLFRPRPATFLPETNTRWFSNLLDAAVDAGVRRIFLISFPHVEGPSTVDQPATGRLDGDPISVHAQTRLEEERALMARAENGGVTPVVLRVGMVYGRGVLMVDAARWLARRGLLGVWREPTWIQLISTTDFLRATHAAIQHPGARGIYHLGDERPVTLQRFLDTACAQWGYRPPARMPVGLIYTAAFLCELTGALLRKPAPLTRDFIDIGRVSYWGDTTRMRQDLLAELEYPDIDAGRSTL